VGLLADTSATELLVAVIECIEYHCIGAGMNQSLAIAHREYMTRSNRIDALVLAALTLLWHCRQTMDMTLVALFKYSCAIEILPHPGFVQVCMQSAVRTTDAPLQYLIQVLT
jgi:hypothetical protein